MWTTDGQASDYNMENISDSDNCVKPASSSGQSAMILALNERVIGRMNADGKWLEFWWKGHIDGSWAVCCKSYVFFDPFSHDQEIYRLNHGCVGMIITWPSDRNDDPTAVRLPQVKP